MDATELKRQLTAHLANMLGIEAPLHQIVDEIAAANDASAKLLERVEEVEREQLALANKVDDIQSIDLFEIEARVSALESASTPDDPEPEPEPQPEPTGVDMSGFGLHARFGNARPAGGAITLQFAQDFPFTIDPTTVRELNSGNIHALFGSVECNMLLQGGTSLQYQDIELDTSQDYLRGDDGKPSVLLHYESTCVGVSDMRNPLVVADKTAAAIDLVKRAGCSGIDCDNCRGWDLGNTIGNLPSNWSAADDAAWANGIASVLRGVRAAFSDLHTQINPSVLYGDSIDYINNLYDDGTIDAVIEEHFSPWLPANQLQRLFGAAIQIRCPIRYYLTADGYTFEKITREQWRTFYNVAALLYKPGDCFVLKFPKREDFIASEKTQLAWRDAVRGLEERTDRSLGIGLWARFAGGREIAFNFNTGQISGDAVEV